MKRMHVHVAVEDLQRSIGFYSALFAAQPAVVKMDYAKWMLDDPRVNFAISTRGRQPGLDHLGIQVEDKDELQEIYARLHEAGGNIVEQGQTSCCYAKSEKSPRRTGLRPRLRSQTQLSRSPALSPTRLPASRRLASSRSFWRSLLAWSWLPQSAAGFGQTGIVRRHDRGPRIGRDTITG